MTKVPRSIDTMPSREDAVVDADTVLAPTASAVAPGFVRRAESAIWQCDTVMPYTELRRADAFSPISKRIFFGRRDDRLAKFGKFVPMRLGS